MRSDTTTAPPDPLPPTGMLEQPLTALPRPHIKRNKGADEVRGDSSLRHFAMLVCDADTTPTRLMPPSASHITNTQIENRALEETLTSINAQKWQNLSLHPHHFSHLAAMFSVLLSFIEKHPHPCQLKFNMHHRQSRLPFRPALSLSAVKKERQNAEARILDGLLPRCKHLLSHALPSSGQPLPLDQILTSAQTWNIPVRRHTNLPLIFQYNKMHETSAILANRSTPFTCAHSATGIENSAPPFPEHPSKHCTYEKGGLP